MEDYVNPSPPEWIDNDTNALLRGDAIGDTAYTHRWILKCLFIITDALSTYCKGINIDKNSIKREIDYKDTNKIENGKIVEKEKNEIGDKYSETKEESKLNSENNIKKVESNDGGDDKSEKIKSLQDINENNSPIDNSANDETLEVKQIMELDSVVEDAACQLWDMTVEKAVTHHLLNLKEVDIIELISIIAEQSLSPRLTEVMIGVMANICCQQEGCEIVLSKSEPTRLLQNILYLLGECSDVPTICESLRLMRLLLWHRINRTPKSCLASCPLIKLLCQEYGQKSIAFLLNNSLNDNLILNLLELLSSFLFICLPETGLNVASLFSDSVVGLMDILERKTSPTESVVDEEQKKITNYAMMCLYSFIDTPGANIVIKVVQKDDSHFEEVLLQHLQEEGQLESMDKIVDECANKLCYILSLCQLIIPYTKCPTLLITVGKLLCLINGQTHHYSVSRSTSYDDTRPKSRSSFSTDESKIEMKDENKNDDVKQFIQDSNISLEFSNPIFNESGWQSPANIDSPIKNTQENISNPNIDSDKNTVISSISHLTKETPEESSNEELSSDLEDLKQSLEDYCYHLLAWWWSGTKCDEKSKIQKNILDILDQCHMDEVLLILKAVRIKDPTLVPRLQEHILDDGSHQRLVALLARMYQ